MSHNNYSYTVFGKADFGLRAGLGFTGGNFSTDGEYVVGNTHSTELCEGCNDALAKPSYVGAGEFPNWPHLSHEEAKALTRKEASAKGASDGWIFPVELP